MKTWKDQLAGFVAQYWDEVLVYFFTLGGAFGFLVNAPTANGGKFHPDFWSVSGAVIASAAFMWLLENRGMKAAAKAGIINTAIKGRRGNIVLRCAGGVLFGYIGQMILPQTLDAIGKTILGLVQGVQNGFSGGAV